jgi:hypothetical protein
MSYQFYSSYKVKKTRRDHKCEWCGERILMGSPAQRASGLFEDFWSGVFHCECYHASQHAEFVDEGWMPHEQARGRTDDDRSLSPEFDELGNKIPSHNLHESNQLVCGAR